MLYFKIPSRLKPPPPSHLLSIIFHESVSSSPLHRIHPPLSLSLSSTFSFFYPFYLSCLPCPFFNSLSHPAPLLRPPVLNLKFVAPLVHDECGGLVLWDVFSSFPTIQDPSHSLLIISLIKIASLLQSGSS